MTQDQTQTRQIAICGAFDMRNFGDLLFPVLAQARLGPLGFDVTAYAPSASDPGLGLASPRPVAQLMDEAVALDGILIGGGYIIHNQLISKLVHLVESAHTVADRSELIDCWVGASLAGVMRDIPVAWNSPGVPFPFASGQGALNKTIVQMAGYFSVRDQTSADLIDPEGGLRGAVVPDPVAELSTLWPGDTLHPLEAKFRNRKGIAPDTEILAIHVRDRSLAGLGAEKLGKMITSFCTAKGLFPVLMGLGQAHADGTTAHLVAQTITTPHVILDDPQSLKEVAAVLSGARLYVGASLHGYIAATSYAVPSVLIARPAYGKFAGFIAHTGWHDDLCRDWEAALTQAETLLGQARSRALPDWIGTALDTHWSAIAKTFGMPPARQAARNDLLRQYVRQGMERRGLSWASLPMTAPSKRS